MKPTEDSGLPIPEPEPEQQEPSAEELQELLRATKRERDDARAELELAYQEMREAERARDEYRAQWINLKEVTESEESATVEALRVLIDALPTRAAGVLKYFGGSALEQAHALAEDRLRLIDERKQK